VATPGVRLPLAEVAPFTVLLEFESAATEGLNEQVEALLAEALEAGTISDAAIAQSEQAAADFWRLRESMPAAHRATGLPQLALDTVVPVSAVPEFIRSATVAAGEILPPVSIVAFGHMGDGNIHFTMLAPSADTAFPREALNERVHDVAVDLGGAISAEHGIGVFRKGELARFKDPVALATMRSVKQALDPKGIMNPRVLFV
jgi:FAD/FMN-containing dehydrogenase